MKTSFSNRAINAKTNFVRGKETLRSYYKSYRDAGHSKHSAFTNAVCIAEGGLYLSIW